MSRKPEPVPGQYTAKEIRTIRSVQASIRWWKQNRIMLFSPRAESALIRWVLNGKPGPTR